MSNDLNVNLSVKKGEKTELVRREVKLLFTEDPSPKTIREVNDYIAKTLGENYVGTVSSVMHSLVKGKDPFLLVESRGVYVLRQDYSLKFYFNRSIEDLKSILSSINLIDCSNEDYDQLLKLRDALKVFEQSVIDA